jgi:hypothetical protein
MGNNHDGPEKKTQRGPACIGRLVAAEFGEIALDTTPVCASDPPAPFAAFRTGNVVQPESAIGGYYLQTGANATMSRFVIDLNMGPRRSTATKGKPLKTRRKSHPDALRSGHPAGYVQLARASVGCVPEICPMAHQSLILDNGIPLFISLSSRRAII